jgi:hypothetical protein
MSFWSTSKWGGFSIRLFQGVFGSGVNVFFERLGSDPCFGSRVWGLIHIGEAKTASAFPDRERPIVLIPSGGSVWVGVGLRGNARVRVRVRPKTRVRVLSSPTQTLKGGKSTRPCATATHVRVSPREGLQALELPLVSKGESRA